MIKLYLDIETLPGSETLREEIESEIKHPGNISRPERIKQWEDEERPSKVEEEYRKTALRGHQGRILCIGYIKERPQGVSEGVITGTEPELLRGFWGIADDVDLFIGFNIFDFDFKFIIQRSIVYGIKPSRELSFARYRNDPIYDVMQEWTLWSRDNISLNDLCKALRIESPKGELDGSKVYDYYLQGKHQEIYEYCLKDVRATMQIYKKMNFLS
ncbi:MAG: ribonuclease H-like domain-containing protein [Chloroflexi bacterium]|nr:ribonuclease H-like domain-containing protein [Chloroflexota bacterium]